MKTIRTLAFTLLVAGAVLPSAAAPADSLAGASPAALRAALLHGAGADDVPSSAMVGRAATGGRSIPLALVLSAAVPGAGQAYNRQWIKAAVAVAAEAALIVTQRRLVRRGHDGEDAYQAYAHAYWDPAKYARWLEDFSAFLPGVDDMYVDVPEGIDFTRPGDWSVQDRRRMRSFFDEMRAIEDAVYHPETGASFSHKIPYYGDQQYYELIGKYFQFAPGWVDYPEWERDGFFNDAIDPDLAGPDGEKINVQGRFWDYARDHAAANDFLRNAQRISGLVVLNHIVAAVDAAVFAKLHNDRLDADLRFTTGADGSLAPVASMRINL